jgi:glutamate-1-semialdehyde aminotransferase
MAPPEFSSSVDATLRHRGPAIPSLEQAKHSLVAERASGAHVWTTDGRRYVDLMLSFGAVVLGHAHRDVDDAVAEALRDGIAPTLHSAHQFRLADELAAVVPGDDLACTFLRTGSDSTSAAVRIARAWTGHTRVVRVGYNGWHDWAAPRPLGVPDVVRGLTTVVPYNDTTALDQVLEGPSGSDLACIVLMPFETELPEPGYFQHVAAAARRCDALLVLDEVRTGFRLAIGGARQHFGIGGVDLVCYSKALANGYAISAVVGGARYFEVVPEVSMSSVFFRSVDGIVAARKTIALLSTGGVYDVLWSRGLQLMDGLRGAADAADVPAAPIGLPPMPFHRFRYGDPEADAQAAMLFASACLDRGILVHPHHQWFVCQATSDKDVDDALSAAHEAYCLVGRMLS